MLRRVRGNFAILMGSALLCAAPATAFANWRTTAGIALQASETYNDSLFLRTGDAAVVQQREGDFITSVRPGFRLRYEKPTQSHEVTWIFGIQKFVNHPNLDNADNRVEWESAFEHSESTRTRFTNLLVHGNVNNVSESAGPGQLDVGSGGSVGAQSASFVYDIAALYHERELDERTTLRLGTTAEGFRPLDPSPNPQGVGGDALSFGTRMEYEIEQLRNIHRSSVQVDYAWLEQRLDFLTAEATQRFTRDITERIEGRIELGAALATDIEPSGMPATRFHDVYYGPVGSARFKYENVFMRFVAELTHSMGANVEYQTLQVEDILSAGVEYVIDEDLYFTAGVSANMSRFTLPGAGDQPDFQRVAVLNGDLELEWTVKDGYVLIGRYNGRVQRATTQVIPGGAAVPFDLDFERNLVTVALRFSLPAEPRMTRLAPDEARRRQEDELERLQDVNAERLRATPAPVESVGEN